MEILLQTVGWIGMILIVLAYLFVSCQYVTVRSRMYQLMNLLGTVGVGINVFHQRAWPAVALQIIWAVITVTSIIRLK